MSRNVSDREKAARVINFTLYRIKGMQTSCENIAKLDFLDSYDRLYLKVAQNSLKRIVNRWNSYSKRSEEHTSELQSH